jgi:hypothetical protein
MNDERCHNSRLKYLKICNHTLWRVALNLCFVFCFMHLASGVETGAKSGRMAACYILNEMKKSDIAKRMARQSKTSVGQAADSVDRLVQEIVAGLRHGQAANLPGLGKLSVKPNGDLSFDREGTHRRD